MKLDIKHPEHIRIAHDTAEGTFTVFIGRGYIHVRANDPKDAQDTTVTIEHEPAANVTLLQAA